MKQFDAKILLFFSCLFSFLQFTQAQVEISGKVINRETEKGVPYCNITAGSSARGTASNELGEFVVTVDSLPTRLIFSHIAYGQTSVEIFETSDIIVSLQPLIANLDEVVVLASKKDAFAKELVRKTFQKANEVSNQQHYGRAFYRQKTKNGGKYSEFSEIFYDIRYNSTGIDDWNIIEGRYALKEDAVHNRNYTAFSRLLRPLQPNTDELIFPTHPSFEIFYNVEVVEMIQASEAKIAVVHFQPLSSIKTPIFEGTVYIDTGSFNILKISGSLARDDLKLSKLNTNNGYWKDYTLSYEIAYKKDSTAYSILDHIKVDQAFDYFKNDSLLYRSITTSNLTFYEHYSPTTRRRLGGKITRNQSDWANLDEIGYNERFWADNPIVKRTPVEEEVIASFERNNAFNSIFLNSAENVALLTANLSEDDFIKKFTSNLNDFNNYNPIEKVYLHTDKDMFSSGEAIWFSAYAVIGPYHQFTAASRVLHVDLIAPDNKIVLSQTHELVNGKSAGAIELPKNLLSGYYQLRAYTQWMRNFDLDFFFNKKLKILNSGAKTATNRTADDKVDLQFFPEGGHAVANIASKIAFKAIASDGHPRSVSGKVIDSEGKSVAVLNTFDRGAGFFQLTPEKGVRYSAILDDGAQYPFPEVLENGFIISVNNLNDKSIKVIVQASPSLRDRPFYVIGHMRQRKYYQGKFEFGKNQIITFEIPKQNMPSGVLTLTLFDENKNPRCERPLFINNAEELVISAKVENQKFEKRNKIDMAIKVTDTYGRPVSTNLSIAVTDKGQVKKDPNTQNMLSYILLESEIKGPIADPNQLFQNEKRSTLNQLDLVMLTHGWRKFPWQEFWNIGDVPKKFSFSKGLTISGVAKTKYGKPLPNATLNIIAKSEDQLGMHTAITEVGGKFSIPDFNLNDSTQIAIHAFDVRDRPVDVKVTMDKTKSIELPLPRFKSVALEKTATDENYLAISNSRKRFNSLYDFNTINELEEVVVTEKKKNPSRNLSPSVYGQTPDATIYTDDHLAIQTVLQLVQLLPGVTVNGTTVSIRNQGTPLWILNGIPVSNDNPSNFRQAREAQRRETEARRGSGDARPAQMRFTVSHSIAPTPAPTFITTMDTQTVERVEVLKGASAAIYGSRGAGGVILIYTKKGEGTPPVLSGDFTIMGHTATREFYAPKYDLKIDAHEKPDYRATLYWNPSTTTDAEGNAHIEFFNSDQAENIQVDIQGLTNTGIPGAYLDSFGD